MKVLLVCLGNICRSPVAEAIFKKKLGSGHLVESRGTGWYHSGGPADRRSIEIAARHGLDISGHVARQLTAEDGFIFDHILVMDRQNLADAQAILYPEHRDKVRLLDPEHEVTDPYYGGPDGFESMYQQLETAVDTFLVEQKQNKPH